MCGKETMQPLKQLHYNQLINTVQYDSTLFTIAFMGSMLIFYKKKNTNQVQFDRLAL